ncbi:hypothetical protein BDW59DRAFT_117289 [Aspergillus cavernicola]|uniref:SRR1-like domain-containing protein n=1 Tax=Aspergillus cavernicola TaxID=176166 RepID=A0ABR4I0V9_9EURO
MPHTTRRNPPSSQQHKRLQITDSSGWTHITTTKTARRLHRSNKARDTNKVNSENLRPDDQEANQEHATIEPLVPAEAPAAVTLPDLQKKLTEYQLRWEGSETWNGARGALQRAFKYSDDDNNDKDKEAAGVSIVCVGLGSPSGFLRGGWVDRRTVSMYQLAALASVKGWIDLTWQTYPPEKKLPPHTLKAYAQDPVFNNHDKSLLNSLGISVLEHPGAFAQVSSRTILFCPGAERRHLELLLARDPAVVLGGPLEDMDSDVVKGFIRGRDSVRLARFEEQEHAFWGMGVYYAPPKETG